MRIQIISDLHQEFGISILDFNDIDLLVVAGDLNIGIKGLNWLLANVIHIPVIYVLGNHEYYKGSYPKTLSKIEMLARGTNIHVLENKAVTIGNVTFHGATFWTDFELFGNPRVYGSMCEGVMSDYKLIRLDPSYSKLRSIDTYNLHKESLQWLEKSLLMTPSVQNIVITHHAPSLKSIPIEFKDQFSSAAYASNLDDFILKHKPNYWIHGHIHTPQKYKIGETTILCNPLGYIDEKYNGYNPKLVIKI